MEDAIYSNDGYKAIIEMEICSKCEKYIRTMVGFHILECLDDYKDVFDI